MAMGGVRLGCGGGWRGRWGRVSAVVAIVIGPAGRGGRVGLVVILAQRCGVVGGGVDVCLLERRWVEVRPLVWQKVVLVQRLEI